MHSKHWQGQGGAGADEARSAFEEDAVFPTGGTAGDMSRRSRFAWALTGSGHYLVECIELALRLPAIDLFLSAAAEEVLTIPLTVRAAAGSVKGRLDLEFVVESSDGELTVVEETRFFGPF